MSMIHASLSIVLLLAQTKPADPISPMESARAQLKQKTADARARFAGNADVQVADGLLADRRTKTVTILACGTGITPDSPVEFFFAPAEASKDYESLASTDVKPSDVKRALEFIGMKPGRPVDFEKNREWARGPRVAMTFTSDGQTIAAEDLITNVETKTTLPHSGFVFGGSFTMTDERGPHLAADLVDARPIAPNFNDPAAVLDLPRRLAQSAIYGHQRPNADHLFKAGELLEIVLTAATPVKEVDLTIELRVDNGQNTFVISDVPGKAATGPAEKDLPHLVTRLAPLFDDATDLYTHVTIDPNARVTDVRNLYAVLMAIEKDHGLKLEPVEKQLFHRAFFPDEQWRKRDGRLGEPWEIFLERDKDKLNARIERSTESTNAETKTTEVERFPAATPDALKSVLAAHPSQWSKAVFIYPPADLTYGELMAWTTPVSTEFPRIFVFLP